MSKSSRFYRNEKRKEAELQKRIDRIQGELAKVLQEDLRPLLQAIDARIDEIEQARDLSRRIIHLDTNGMYILWLVFVFWLSSQLFPHDFQSLLCFSGDARFASAMTKLNPTKSFCALTADRRSQPAGQVHDNGRQRDVVYEQLRRS
jgi:hypothetical protein